MVRTQGSFLLKI